MRRTIGRRCWLGLVRLSRKCLNLYEYHPSTTPKVPDVCVACSARVNLHAFTLCDSCSTSSLFFARGPVSVKERQCDHLEWLEVSLSGSTTTIGLKFCWHGDPKMPMTLASNEAAALRSRSVSRVSTTQPLPSATRRTHVNSWCLVCTGLGLRQVVDRRCDCRRQRRMVQLRDQSQWSPNRWVLRRGTSVRGTTGSSSSKSDRISKLLPETQGRIDAERERRVTQPSTSCLSCSIPHAWSSPPQQAIKSWIRSFLQLESRTIHTWHKSVTASHPEVRQRGVLFPPSNCELG